MYLRTVMLSFYEDRPIMTSFALCAYEEFYVHTERVSHSTGVELKPSNSRINCGLTTLSETSLAKSVYVTLSNMRTSLMIGFTSTLLAIQISQQV